MKIKMKIEKKKKGNRNQSDYMIRDKKRQIKINNKILERE